MKPTVFVTRARASFPTEEIEKLEQECEVTYWKDDSVIPKQDLILNVKNKDAIICLLTDRIDSDVLKEAGKLRVLATMSVGFDHLDVEGLKGKGVQVCVAMNTKPWWVASVVLCCGGR